MGVQVDTCDPVTGPLGAASRYSCARFGRCFGWRGRLGFRVKGWPLKQWERQDFCPRSFDIGASENRWLHRSVYVVLWAKNFPGGVCVQFLLGLGCKDLASCRVLVVVPQRL